MRAKTNYSIIDASVKASPKNHSFTETILILILEIERTLMTKKKFTSPKDRNWGYAVEQLVEALRYNSEGRGFDSRWRHSNFSLT